MSSRLATFFYLIAVGLFILFLGSIFSGRMQVGYFFTSALAIFIGFLFQRSAPRVQSGRFGAINKARENSRLRREVKQLKEKEKDSTKR